MPDLLDAAFHTATPTADIVLRLVLACILGAALGFDRERRGRAAGLRTFTMTALGAAAYALISIEIAAQSRAGGSTDADAVRAVQAIAQGIAFLAAGAIIHGRGSVKGLTTGAGIWLAGAAGLAAGAGLLPVALLTTLLGLCVLWPLRSAESLIGEHESEKNAASPSSRDAAR